MSTRLVIVVSIMVISVVAVVMILLAPKVAWSHEWYEDHCCNEQDCRPAEPGEVSVTPLGYKIGDWIVPFTGDERVRRSQNEYFHICMAQIVDNNGDAMWYELRCLYVPDTTM